MGPFHNMLMNIKSEKALGARKTSGLLINNTKIEIFISIITLLYNTILRGSFVTCSQPGGKRTYVL